MLKTKSIREAYILMQILKRGDRGPAVEILQLGLIRSGYLAGPPDGVFGPVTLAALLRFQRRFGVTATGETDGPTWEYLKRFVRGFYIKRAEAGDTLWCLATEAGCTAAEIRAANPDVDPRDIRVGQRLVVPFGFAVVPEDATASFALTELLLEGLRARYPFLRTQSMGESVMGRQIPVVSAGLGERRLFVSAAIHANEWITSLLALSFLEDWLRAYVNGRAFCGADAGELFTGCRLILAPMVNPDGVDLAAGALREGPRYEEAAAIAARYPAVPFPEGWKANVTGTDLNLQFPAGWQRAREIKFAQGFVSPAPRDYVGKAPLCAPEAKALAELTDEKEPDLAVALHTQGRLIYWRYGGLLPPHSERIAEALSRASGYALADPPERSAYAGYKDWFIETRDRPGYTVEAGLGRNPLPLSQFAEIYAEIKPLLFTAMRETASL